MIDATEAEVILQEILDVLQKHGIPVNTVQVDFSLLEHDFDLVFPQLRDKKWRSFYRSLVIDSKPATLSAGRR